MAAKLIEALKAEMLGHPGGMPDDMYEDVRGRLAWAIGETEIRNAGLRAGRAPSELDDLGLCDLWSRLADGLDRRRIQGRLSYLCREVVAALQLTDLDSDTQLELLRTYLDEIRQVAPAEGFRVE